MNTLVNASVSSVVGVLLGVISFVIVRAFLDAQDTSSWTSAEASIMLTAVPVAVALVTLVAAFAGLTRMST